MEAKTFFMNCYAKVELFRGCQNYGLLIYRIKWIYLFYVIEEDHETEIHVQLHVAVE
jgi:hypothetical protein